MTADLTPEDLAERVSKWNAVLARPVGQQVQISDDLLQMTTSPLAQNDPSDWSMSELLHHQCPPVPWLKGVAQYAKASLRDHSLDPSIAAALYHAAVAAALVRRSVRVTRASDAVLDLGLADTLSHPWLDRHTHRLLDDARHLLRPLTPTVD